MARKTIPVVVEKGPACGQCQWYEPDSGEDYGECFFNPPQASLAEDGTVNVVRPFVGVDERACSRFKGRQ